MTTPILPHGTVTWIESVSMNNSTDVFNALRANPIPLPTKTATGFIYNSQLNVTMVYQDNNQGVMFIPTGAITSQVIG